MLLTITYKGNQTDDLGYLLHKNPFRPQSIELSMGKAHIFYPEISEERTTAALLVELDPLDLAKGREGLGEKGLFAYVNDRPYVASSFLSNAIARAFGTAMTGRCDSRPELACRELALTAGITMLPVRGDKQLIKEIFEPLGYDVSYETFPIDEQFPSWGECDYVNLRLMGEKRLSELLNQLYILIPVFDLQRHYYVGENQIDNLLKHGKGWLESHPLREKIIRRYFSMAKSYAEEALRRLSTAAEAGEVSADEYGTETVTRWSLDRERLSCVRDEVIKTGAHSCLDLGCGEGKLLQLLLQAKDPGKLAGADVSREALRKAEEHLALNRLAEKQRERISLFQASILYQDERFRGYDCICLIEVLEHIEPERLPMLEQVVFGWTASPFVIVTTPNRLYNSNYGLAEGELRHEDHRFEWTEQEFREWALNAAGKYGYTVSFSGIGAKEGEDIAPTQMGVFVK